MYNQKFHISFRNSNFTFWNDNLFLNHKFLTYFKKFTNFVYFNELIPLFSQDYLFLSVQNPCLIEYPEDLQISSN